MKEVFEVTVSTKTYQTWFRCADCGSTVIVDTPMDEGPEPPYGMEHVADRGPRCVSCSYHASKGRKIR